jgi:DNA-nicking Smr family endonuclease
MPPVDTKSRDQFSDLLDNSATDSAAAWQDFTRSVKRLPKSAQHPKPKAKPSPEAVTKPTTAPSRRFTRKLLNPTPTAAQRAPTITITLLPTAAPDAAVMVRRIERGALKIAARLDLHALTEAAAHAAVQDFMLQASRQNWRLVLIITGRGQVLQHILPRWLQHPALAKLIRWTHMAAARHGGAGAFYVLLR